MGLPTHEVPAAPVVPESQCAVATNCLVFTAQHSQAVAGDWFAPAYKTNEGKLNFFKKTRKFYIWRNSSSARNFFAHQSLVAAYETTIGNHSFMRFFKADILVDETKKVFLNFVGPEKKVTDAKTQDVKNVPFDCCEYQRDLDCVYVSSLNGLRMVCEEVFQGFEDYTLWGNNCKHFVDKVLERLSEEKPDSEYSKAELTLEQYLEKNRLEVADPLMCSDEPEDKEVQEKGSKILDEVQFQNDILSALRKARADRGFDPAFDNRIKQVEERRDRALFECLDKLD